MKILKYFTLGGNAVFILWILYNGVDEGFKGIATIQGIVPLVLAVLLAFNLILLLRTR